jgi:hypothetical protein
MRKFKVGMAALSIHALSAIAAKRQAHQAAKSMSQNVLHDLQHTL